jgi:hypothetical protein
MAESTIAQPALYLDSAPRVVRENVLFSIEYDGLTLKLTPYAMMGLVLKSRRAFEDWNAINNAKAAGIVVDDAGAEIIAFPKAAKIVRCVGEAC